MKRTKFVICIDHHGEDDLVPGKVYQVLEDEAAIEKQLLRIIDESGEDYLYPSSFFISISLPEAARRALFTESAPPAPST